MVEFGFQRLFVVFGCGDQTCGGLVKLHIEPGTCLCQGLLRGGNSLTGQVEFFIEQKAVVFGQGGQHRGGFFEILLKQDFVVPSGCQHLGHGLFM